MPREVETAEVMLPRSTSDYGTSTDGRVFLVTVRDRTNTAVLSLDAKGCVALASKLLAGADLLFKEEGLRVPTAPPPLLNTVPDASMPRRRRRRRTTAQ